MNYQMQAGTEPERYFTPEDLAEILNLPISSVYKMLREQKIAGIRIGNLWRVSKTDLDTFIQNCSGSIND
jgi:excisionase family DNA binding protein